MHLLFQGLLARGVVARLSTGLALALCAALAAADPPGRVGRLAEATGPVWLFSPGSPEWTAAPLNRPLTSGERLSTDPGVRAVVRIGSTALRVDGGTEVEFSAVEDDRIRLLVHAGSLAVSVRSPDKVDELDLRTAEGRLLLQRPGRYRIDRADGATAVTVHAGQALFEGHGAAQTIFPRQRAEFWMDSRLGDRMQYAVTEPMQDAFTGWVASRDLADERGASARYVSPEMTGAEDLDRYGRWEEHPDYGALWMPAPSALPPGWAPYRFGQWAWIQPWGWTWIDDAPWGFAPFHYGRWMRWREGWAWAPGRWVARPVYAPALVAWVGGSSASVSVQIGGGPAVGWFPLAPREVYVPWYGVTPRYVQSINLTHVTQIDNLNLIVTQPGAVVGRYPYAHRWYEPALTVAPGGALVGRQPVPTGGQRWIIDPGVRQAWSDPSRGPGVVPDPGLRPPVGMRPPVSLPGRVPPGAVEPDRRLQIPERMGRLPVQPDPTPAYPLPSQGGRVVPLPPGYAPPAGPVPQPAPPMPGYVPPQPIQPAVPPPPQRPGRPGELPFQAMPPAHGAWSTIRPAQPMPSPGGVDSRPNEEAARRIGRDAAPAPLGRLPQPQPQVLQAPRPMQPMTPPPQMAPQPPMAPPPPRSVGRIEIPPRPAEPGRPPEMGRLPVNPDLQRDRRDSAR